MNWLKKAPTPVIVTLIIVSTVAILGVLSGYFALIWSGRPTDDYWVFVNRLVNIISVPLTALAAGGAVSAARSAGEAAEQTNGHLADRDDEIRELRDEVRRLADWKAGH